MNGRELHVTFRLWVHKCVKIHNVKKYSLVFCSLSSNSVCFFDIQTQVDVSIMLCTITVILLIGGNTQFKNNFEANKVRNVMCAYVHYVICSYIIFWYHPVAQHQ